MPRGKRAMVFELPPVMEPGELGPQEGEEDVTTAMPLEVDRGRSSAAGAAAGARQSGYLKFGRWLWVVS